MADSEDSVPPPPPGFEDVAAGSNEVPAEDPEVDKAADELGKTKVSEENPEAEGVDAPDAAIKSDKLAEQEEGEEVQKVLASNDTTYVSAKTFEELGLSQELLQGLYSEMKFEKPSPIQAETLPMILTPPFKNLIAQAKNGTGKTACFTLGSLSRIDPSLKAPQSLCICPTRELVVQNVMVMEKMSKYTGITIGHSADGRYAGSSRNKIIDQAIIGTPGTVLRWFREKMLDTKEMRILVFDEADDMMDNTHRVNSLKIMKHLQKNRGLQVLLFSATFNERVKDFAMKVVPNANQTFIPAAKLSLDVIKQYQVHVASDEAKDVLLKEKIFPCCDKIGQTIIFVRRRQQAVRLRASMESAGYKCTAICGKPEMQDEDRDRVIREFREGLTKILIATDIIARGLDISTVTLVVNYDMPRDFQNPRLPNTETYLHRIGRSGRFGKKGAAFNLILGRDEASVMDQIASHFAHPVPELKFDDDETFEKVLEQAGLMSKEEDV